MLLITGLGRSGSTLIQKVMNCHPDIFVSDESWHFYRSAKQYINKDQNVLMGMSDTQYAAYLGSALELLYSNVKGTSKLVGDKCPPAYILLDHIKLILQAAGHPLSVIWTVRHPYDQVLSWKERFGMDSLLALRFYGQQYDLKQYSLEFFVEIFFRAWRIQQEIIGNQNGHVIIYEKLVDDPASEFKHAHESLGLSFRDSQLKDAFDGKVYGGDLKFNSTDSVHSTSKYRYLNESLNNRRMLDNIARKTGILVYFDAYDYKS